MLGCFIYIIKLYYPIVLHCSEDSYFVQHSTAKLLISFQTYLADRFRSCSFHCLSLINFVHFREMSMTNFINRFIILVEIRLHAIFLKFLIPYLAFQLAAENQYMRRAQTSKRNAVSSCKYNKVTGQVNSRFLC